MWHEVFSIYIAMVFYLRINKYALEPLSENDCYLDILSGILESFTQIIL